MRLSMSLHEDLYAAAKSLAKAQDLSLSAAVNQLIRRSLEPRPATSLRPSSDGTGLPAVPCTRLVTTDDLDRLDG